MNNGLRTIGLAKAAGCLLSGEDTVRNAARKGKVKLLLLASDVGSSGEKRARQINETSGAPIIRLSCSKTELGGAIGLETVSIAAVTDAGFAGMLRAKLESREEE